MPERRDRLAMSKRSPRYLLLMLAALLMSCSQSDQNAPSQNRTASEDIRKSPTPKVSSQSPAPDTTVAGRYFTKAEEFVTTDILYDSAIVYFSKARALYENEQNWDMLVRCYQRIGRSFRERGEFAQAIKYLDQALAIGLKELGDRHGEIATTYSTLSITYRSMGDYARALDFANKALSIQIATLGENDALVGQTYNRIANVYSEKNDLDQSLAYRKKAVAIYVAVYGERSAEAGSFYNNIGNDYLDRGDIDQALFFHKKSLELKEEFLGKNNQAVAWSHDNLGQVYYKKGDYERARECYENALSIWRETIGTENLFSTMAYDHLIELNWRTGDYAQAIAFSKKSLSIKQRVLGERHPSVADTYNLMAQVYRDHGDYDSALEKYQAALQSNVPTFSDSDPMTNPPLTGILGERQLLESLAGKAQTFAARYFKKTGNIHDLELAASTYQDACKLIEHTRSGYKVEGSKLFLAEKAVEVYDQAVQSTLALYRITQKDEYKNAAFSFAEKSKAGIMLEALSDAEAKKFAGLPDSVLAKEKQLRIDLAFYDKSLSEEMLKREDRDSAKISLWQDQLFHLQQAYTNLLQRFEEEYPDYYKLKYQINTASAAEVQQHILDGNTALVEYFTGKDSIFIFALTKRDVYVAAVPNDSLLERYVRKFREAIVAQDSLFALYTQLAHRLYQILLEPIKDQIAFQNLIIVPDGILSIIPFEALLTHAVEIAGKPSNYATLPFLVNECAISYAYSATLLLEKSKSKRAPTERDFLAFAPVHFGGIAADSRGGKFVKANLGLDTTRAEVRAGLGDLRLSEDEVNGIGERFKKSYGLFDRWFSSKSRVYIEKQASEQQLKSSDLSRYRFVHFATHGFVNETFPKLSGLLLPQNDAPAEDGILQLSEIYNLHFNADLVTLSACETGLGKIAKGEGMIGLTRGFLFAGAQNLLVSLWRVDDPATAHLMIDFYDKMLTGLNKSESLRQAKLSMIHHPEAVHFSRPYYWAPFILIGR